MIEMSRQTGETDIRLKLELKGRGQARIDTGIGFFDHMLELWACHGFFDLELEVVGDLEVDAHHTVEDTGIVLGQALDRGLGRREGISRYGQVLLPMDESLVMVALDVGGRAYYVENLEFSRNQVGGFPVELLEEFFYSLTQNGQFNLHLRQLNGGNTHHLLEACFKGFARALDRALQPEARLQGDPLTTKGRLKG
ncbi:MAG: imidazoleglycerol-phosphate dehydratase HisB [Bacillota bacterium]